jgi:hypothetical protein
LRRFGKAAPGSKNSEDARRPLAVALNEVKGLGAVEFLRCVQDGKSRLAHGSRARE